MEMCAQYDNYGAFTLVLLSQRRQSLEFRDIMVVAACPNAF
jgi:hypothetical protein